MLRNRNIMFIMGCAVVAAIVLAVYAYNPSETLWMPKCPFKLLTGWQCPSCGTTRALHLALHGQFARALSMNYYLIVSLPLAAAIIYRVTASRRIGDRLGLTLIYAYVITYLIWWVVRNILNI